MPLISNPMQPFSTGTVQEEDPIQIEPRAFGQPPSMTPPPQHNFNPNFPYNTDDLPFYHSLKMV